MHKSQDSIKSLCTSDVVTFVWEPCLIKLYYTTHHSFQHADDDGGGDTLRLGSKNHEMLSRCNPTLPHKRINKEVEGEREKQKMHFDQRQW